MGCALQATTTFFRKGKLADVLVIATQDRDHYGHAMRALKLGYDVLLEKPVSPNVNECIEIAKYAAENGRKVLVCHVLRYAPYYRRIKEIIESGQLGEVVEIRHSENISYWHFSHSYVRGNWRSEAETSPMLLAKCCHDMDLLFWYAGSKFQSLSSYGELKFFKEENAPAGAAKRCADCKLNKTCIYDADYQYVGRRRFLLNKRKFPWGSYAFSMSNKKADVKRALREGEKGRLYGRCVFASDNDVVDNQTVTMLMQNGVKCQFSVNAFNENNHRHTEIRGTMGELYADDSGSVLKLRLFDKAMKKIRVNVISMVKGHAGGDAGIIRAVMAMYNGETHDEQYTWISDTVESHRIVAAAELSRHEHGRTVYTAEIPDLK
jgi:Predicted dehydrogenases and related proteins